MIIWMILAGYLTGTIVGARLALQMRMSRPVCNHPRNRHTEFLNLCREYHGPHCAVPVGEIRARQMSDGAVALLMGVAWPAVIAMYLIMHTTPPTDAESRRLLAEQSRRIENQSKDIARLQREMEAGR